MVASCASWGIHKSVEVCGLQVLNGDTCCIETVILQELQQFLGLENLGEEKLTRLSEQAEQQLWGLAVSISHDWAENVAEDDNTLTLEVYQVQENSRWKALTTHHGSKQTIGLLFQVGCDGKVLSNLRRLVGEKENVVIPNAAAMTDCLGKPLSVAIRAFLAGRRCDASFTQVWGVCKERFTTLVGAIKREAEVELIWSEAHLRQVHLHPDPLTQVLVEKLLPQFGMATGALIRPVLVCLTKRRLRIEELGVEYTSHFMLLHLLSILGKAGLQQSALARVATEFPHILDGLKQDCVESIQLTIRLVPFVLEHAIQATLEGTPHEGICAYLSALLLLELAKSPSVQLVIGHIDAHQRQAIPKLSQALVRRAIFRLHGVFEELGTICPEAQSITQSTVARSINQFSGSLPTLDAVASRAAEAVPPVPEQAVIGAAASAGFVAALLTSRGCNEVRKALAADQVQSWRDKVTVGTQVEYLCRDNHNWVVAEVTKTPTASTLVLRHRDLIARRPRAASDIRPVGLEGAIVDWLGSEDLDTEQGSDDGENTQNGGLDLSDMSPLPSPRTAYTASSTLGTPSLPLLENNEVAFSTPPNDDVDNESSFSTVQNKENAFINESCSIIAGQPAAISAEVEDVGPTDDADCTMAEPEGDLSTVASENEL